jgi:poly-gamma-glutamate synthesis protein (capsule biosynthesis protein)
LSSKSPLDPDWEGNGKPITVAFVGDNNFPAGSTLAARLADDPATALGPGAQQLLAGGYLGSAYVDYGLGNFAFYNDPPPTDQSGSLVITATGRHIDNVTWRPAIIEDDLPQPLTGAAAASALQSWTAARSCTDAPASPGAALATPTSETSPPSAAAVAQLSVDSG